MKYENRSELFRFVLWPFFFYIFRGDDIARVYGLIFFRTSKANPDKSFSVELKLGKISTGFTNSKHA